MKFPFLSFSPKGWRHQGKLQGKRGSSGKECSVTITGTTLGFSKGYRQNITSPGLQFKASRAWKRRVYSTVRKKKERIGGQQLGGNPHLCMRKTLELRKATGTGPDGRHQEPDGRKRRSVHATKLFSPLRELT
jgi:hypothetical protein